MNPSLATGTARFIFSGPGLPDQVVEVLPDDDGKFTMDFPEGYSSVRVVGDVRSDAFYID